VNKYFRRDRVIQGGIPGDALGGDLRKLCLHAVFRQNYGCSHLIVGRDHAAWAINYGPFDAPEIFQEIPARCPQAARAMYGLDVLLL